MAGSKSRKSKKSKSAKAKSKPAKAKRPAAKKPARPAAKKAPAKKAAKKATKKPSEEGSGEEGREEEAGGRQARREEGRAEEGSGEEGSGREAGAQGPGQGCRQGRRGSGLQAGRQAVRPLAGASAARAGPGAVADGRQGGAAPGGEADAGGRRSAKPSRRRGPSSPRRRSTRGGAPSLRAKKEEIMAMYLKDLKTGQESNDSPTEDIVDRANNSYSRELNFSISDTERGLLLQIDEALERLDAGTYGSAPTAASRSPGRGSTRFRGPASASIARSCSSRDCSPRADRSPGSTAAAMRLRSFFGLLLALAAAFVVSYHVKLNGVLLEERFHLGPETSIPLWGAVLGVFLAGFLPVGVMLVTDTLRHELASRKRPAAPARGGEPRSHLPARRRSAGRRPARARRRRSSRPISPAAPSLSSACCATAVLRELGREGEAIEVHRRATVLFPHSVAACSTSWPRTTRRRARPRSRARSRGGSCASCPASGLEVLRRRRAEAVGRRDWAEASKLHESVTRLLNESGDARALARDAGLARRARLPARRRGCSKRTARAKPPTSSGACSRASRASFRRGSCSARPS